MSAIGDRSLRCSLRIALSVPIGALMPVAPPKCIELSTIRVRFNAQVKDYFAPRTHVPHRAARGDLPIVETRRTVACLLRRGRATRETLPGAQARRKGGNGAAVMTALDTWRATSRRHDERAPGHEPAW